MQRSVLALLAVALSGRLSAQADLIVLNARLYTADVTRPVAEALAVRDGRIAFVGSARGALALIGPRTERLDAVGLTVIPGMVDAHAHLLNLGQALRTVDLVGTRSFDEVIARVREQAARTPPGEWIRGRGWDQNDWADTRFPTHAAWCSTPASCWSSPWPGTPSSGPCARTWCGWSRSASPWGCSPP